MSSRLTVDQLEQMKTHELADLLANVVLVLRRIQDVPLIQLQTTATASSTQSAGSEKKTIGTNAKLTPAEAVALLSDVNSLIYTEEELKRKTVADLKRIAGAMHMPTSAKKKDDLVSKILARQGHEHSEQFAIQNM